MPDIRTPCAPRGLVGKDCLSIHSKGLVSREEQADEYKPGGRKAAAGLFGPGATFLKTVGHGRRRRLGGARSCTPSRAPRFGFLNNETSAASQACAEGRLRRL